MDQIKYGLYIQSDELPILKASYDSKHSQFHTLRYAFAIQNRIVKLL